MCVSAFVCLFPGCVSQGRGYGAITESFRKGQLQHYIVFFFFLLHSIELFHGDWEVVSFRGLHSEWLKPACLCSSSRIMEGRPTEITDKICRVCSHSLVENLGSWLHLSARESLMLLKLILSAMMDRMDAGK